MKYRILIEYDGSGFCGWQRQQGQPSVQETLERALAVALRAPVQVIGAGRTDSGVHARGQVAHFAAPDLLDVRRVLKSVNALTPPSVAVLALAPAHDDFHARFDAIRRRYHYHVSCQPVALARRFRYRLPFAIDFCVMNTAAAYLVRKQHFGAFCLHRSAMQNKVCDVTRATWVREDRPSLWRFEVEADRFLHGMVRAMVGTLLEVGRGRRAPTDVVRVLDSRDRRQAGPAAPAHGLVLESVHYREIKKTY